MILKWLDVQDLSFNSLLLLERVQIDWLPRMSVPPTSLAVALRANPAVEWYLRHKCPEIGAWLDGIMASNPPNGNGRDPRTAEMDVMAHMNDWLVYVIDPSIYDAQPFLGWDSAELLSLVDFRATTTLDIGSGTGRLAFTAAPLASVVFAVEPVANLRRYLREKAHRLGHRNVYVVDGLMEAIPFPDGFADVTLSGHVFGDDPAAEHREVERVTRPGGMIVHCPGTSVRGEEAAHEFLVEAGFEWAVFEEPRDGQKRKYWKRV